MKDTGSTPLHEDLLSHHTPVSSYNTIVTTASYMYVMVAMETKHLAQN